MNKKMIVYILGKILLVEGLLLLFPVLISLLYQEQAAPAYLLTAASVIILGTALSRRAPKNRNIYAREGFFIVAVSWLLLSAFGAIPLVLTGEIPSVIDAFFETVSGFTTTGSSILTDVDALSHASLFWRSFTHWIGGMGILVFTAAFIPLTSGRTMHILKAEMPGPVVGKLVAKTRVTAQILYVIYGALTLIEVLLLRLGGMPWFDSLLNAFATAGTGGFSMSNAGISGYHSGYLEWVITIFMILFGINFNVLYLMVLRRAATALKNEELRWYLGIIAAAILAITINIANLYSSVGEALRYAAFQVASIITTTGFATADYDQWPLLSQTILLLLMFIGACSGSTGGGIKVSRIVMLLKNADKELQKLLHPRSVNTVEFEGGPVALRTLNNMHAYLVFYLLFFAGALLIVSLENLDFHSAFSAVTTCINNIGPGFNRVGPTANFAFLSDLSKVTLSFTMLAGRLEIFPILLLFSPSFWRN